MRVRPRQPWLPRLLFRLTVTASALLLALVLLAPLLDNTLAQRGVGSRPLTLFARDATLRRTSVASALGLLVTASVFFRSPGRVPLPRKRRPPRRQPPPAGVAGA